jgi:3-phosphoshikimate 1-carboxyvinyltransferase
MFRAMGIRFQDTVLDNGVHQIEISGPQTLQAQSLQVPGDISSAAFFMVGATIVPGSDVLIKNVGLNPTRSGVLDVLLRMGADIQVVAESFASGEPVGDLRVRSAKLTGTIIGGAEIPRMVDELPIIAVAAAEAHGETLVRDAKELRVKESDRIEATVRILTGMGVDAVPTDDGFVVQGSPQGPRSSFEVWAEGDHRIAMTASIGALQCQGTTTVHGSSSMQTSFPGFMETLERLRA